MSIKNIIRAWKDEDYRLNLSEAERASCRSTRRG